MSDPPTSARQGCSARVDQSAIIVRHVAGTHERGTWRVCSWACLSALLNATDLRTVAAIYMDTSG